MAKMFYSEDEAAAKLGISPEELESRARRGEVERLINAGKPVYKASQIDLLTNDGGGGGSSIPLADSRTDDAISLADSGAMPAAKGGGETTKEKSGISIFEADDLEDTSDASAQTQITGSVGGVKVGDPNASGSGLLNLTRDSKDDTGIGAGILGDAYDKDSRDQSADLTATPVGGSPALRGGGGAVSAPSMFEDAGVASDVGMAAAGAAGAGMMMVAVEPIDKLSGLVGGLALGMVIVCVVAIAVVFMAMGGATGGLVALVAGNLWAVVGGLAGVLVVCAIVGLLVGKVK
jgi:hypothetical protein